MNLDLYLNRIGMPSGVRPDLSSLRALHRAHLFAIPYENLDVQLGRALATAPGPIFEKLVTNGRGGWCYEMNGLFAWALGEIGFDVTRLPGAVMREFRGDAAIGNHLVLKVHLPEGNYLADVGFGDGPIDPVRIEEGEFQAHGFSYSLSRLDEHWWRLHKPPGSGAASFDFSERSADEAMLAERCKWLQSAPESSFVQTAVCQRYTMDGLAILRGRSFRTLTPHHQSERLLASGDEYVSVLKSIFGLEVPEAYALWPKICARHEEFVALQLALGRPG